MSELKFDDGSTSRKLTAKPTLLSYVVKSSFGLIKNESQAAITVLIVAILLIVFSFNSLASKKVKVINGGPGPSQEELREYNKMQR